ncbi:MAG: cob(I)yrinic acid a,c-diamide adenosyltransferase [Acidobacteria bacterium]|nr:cob(I)yrinic acid a,c-diamide adenosyltransferase [Acidobacteriota bacterium]
MSIATRTGDAGETSLIGNSRVSKADLRVEVCGCLDELVSQLGFARSICEHADTRALLEDLQRQLFLVAEEAASGGGTGTAALIEAAHVEALTRHVHRIEAQPGIVGDWTLPGGHVGAAAIDVARTSCRRAERALVRLKETGGVVGAHTLPFMNRLSDLLWLLGRVVEQAAGVDGRLRDPESSAPRWSRAWSRDPTS